ADGDGVPADTTATVVDGNLLEDAYQALLSVGHSPFEARDRLDRVLAGGHTYQSVEEILLAIYKLQQSLSEVLGQRLRHTRSNPYPTQPSVQRHSQRSL